MKDMKDMKDMKSILAITLAVALSISATGCSAVNKALDTVAEANDKALNSAEFTICKGASVGSILRRYKTAEQISAWQLMCLSSVASLIVTEPSK